jgi:hypothetical protein
VEDFYEFDGVNFTSWKGRPTVPKHRHGISDIERLFNLSGLLLQDYQGPQQISARRSLTALARYQFRARSFAPRAPAAYLLGACRFGLHCLGVVEQLTRTAKAQEVYI